MAETETKKDVEGKKTEETELTEQKRQELCKLLSSDEHMVYDKFARKCVEYFKIITKTGNPDLQFPVTKLTDLEYVKIILISRRLAKDLRFISTGIVCVNEIAKIIGKTQKLASARLSEAAKKGFAEQVEKGKYRLSGLMRAERFLENLSKKRQTNKI